MISLRELLERLHWLDPKPAGIEAAARACTDRGGQLNRRAFLGLMGAAVAVAGLDPERLLWTPGEKAVALATPAEIAEVTGNVFATPAWVCKEALRLLENQLAFVGSVTRAYDEKYAARVGDTLPVRRPRRFEDSQPFAPFCDHLDRVMLTDQYLVELPDPGEMTLDDARAKIIAPAMGALADRLRANGQDVFVAPPLAPLAASVAVGQTVENTVSGRGLRLIGQYDVEDMRMRYRFDVLGGSSHAAVHQARVSRARARARRRRPEPAVRRTPTPRQLAGTRHT